MAGCDKTKKFFREYIDANTGETRYKLAGFLSAPIWELGKKAARVLEKDERGGEFIRDPGDFAELANDVLRKANPRELHRCVDWMPRQKDWKIPGLPISSTITATGTRARKLQ